MGKISILSPEQKTILAGLRESKFIKDGFYLTGGTALAEYYLQHRLSEDLDFFSDEKFDNQTILAIMEGLAKKQNFTFTSRLSGPVYSFMVEFPDKKKTKLDFGFYPYKRLRKSEIEMGLQIDSLLDIAVNKLMVVIQRENVKDFIDLYYLLKKFTLWDLLEGVRIKFRQKPELFLLATDFLKIEEFDFLPKMVKPLDIEKLKKYYRKLAKKVGEKGVVR